MDLLLAVSWHILPWEHHMQVVFCILGGVAQGRGLRAGPAVHICYTLMIGHHSCVAQQSAMSDVR